MHKLELKIPPVLVLLIVMFLAYLTQFLPELISDLVISPLYWILSFILGLVIIAAGVWQFRKAQTTVNPTTPEKASNLVQSGVFKVTRNPMYLGMACLLIAVVLYIQNIYGLPCILLFVAYINQFQIKPEERMIEQLFGQEYIDYKSKVRRWI
ncbi:isoprenylcysteine carboxylmethyltransferase family protein [Paraglaciecola aquimarina]|uniref:Isoprenylcysteine carboxylmethyltransferase family protein n=1 Tax=Paraglaciecola algarum TaxID=3050085 RepID=A0ABS9D474_9ALTE|nr:isoprenylcysteine carboxylmethyltransferase family protein [Paraglaciecola sp. G1-23]MCF2946822.1 isoprenylcysteine carboxylmethyltransferase family protein [Paraglaciecola sp. G1-23]